MPEFGQDRSDENSDFYCSSGSTYQRAIPLFQPVNLYSLSAYSLPVESLFGFGNVLLPLEHIHLFLVENRIGSSQNSVCTSRSVFRNCIAAF